MKRKVYLRWFAAVVLVGCIGSGCASISTLHTATPVEQGKIEAQTGLGYIGVSAKVFESFDTDGEVNQDRQSLNLPTIEGHGRFGIADGLGVGIKVFPIGLGLDVNYAPVNTDSFAFAINPSLSGMVFGPLAMGNASLNLLADVVKSERIIFTLGAKPSYLFASAGGEGGGIFSLGGVAVLEFKFNDTFSLRPGFDLIYPLENNQSNAYLAQGMLGLAITF